MAIYTLTVAGLGLLTWSWFGRKSDTPARVMKEFEPVHKLLWNKYYIDEIYQWVFVDGLLALSRGLLRWLDQGLVDGAVNASAWLAEAAGAFLRQKAHSGQIRLYAAALLAGVCLLLGLVWAYAGVPVH